MSVVGSLRLLGLLSLVELNEEDTYLVNFKICLINYKFTKFEGVKKGYIKKPLPNNERGFNMI
jgi:hypothetical protein